VVHVVQLCPPVGRPSSQKQRLGAVIPPLEPQATSREFRCITPALVGGGDFAQQPDMLPAQDRLVARYLHGCTRASAGVQEAPENTSL
jgi:hypothetical protein